MKTLNTSNRLRSHKDKNHANQLQTIFQYLQEHTATASMVAEATGIYQKNITRYKRVLQRAGRLWIAKRKPCEITGFEAAYLTTDPNKAPSAKTAQLDLFKNGRDSKL